LRAQKRPASDLATPTIICLCKGSAKLQPAKRRMVSDATQTGRGDGAKQTDNAAAPVHKRNRAKRLHERGVGTGCEAIAAVQQELSMASSNASGGDHPNKHR